MKRIEIRVETYDGYKPDQRPCRFRVAEKHHEIQEILSEAREERLPQGEMIARFQVRCRDGNVFQLEHHLHENRWILVGDAGNREGR